MRASLLDVRRKILQLRRFVCQQQRIDTGATGDEALGDHELLGSILVFIVFQFALASALDGESWQGMQILLTAVIIVPVVALANFWIAPIAWRSKKRAFTADLLLPAGVGLVEYLWFSAGYRQQRAVIDAVGTDSSVTIVCLATLFAPLVASILCAGAKRVRLSKA